MALYGLKVLDPLALPIGASKIYKKFTKKCLIFNKKYDIIYM